MRADLAEGQDRLTALESSVQKIREAQQQDVTKDIMDLVNTRLQTFETHIDAKVREWAASTVRGCQKLEGHLDSLVGIQEQLGKIQEKQTEF